MTRLIYERKVKLTGWDTHLTWIKSGAESKVMSVPYEIYSKRYSPSLLSVGPLNNNLAFELGDELRRVALSRHLKPDHLMQAKATAVVGKSLDTRTKARQQYIKDGKTATEHTYRYRVGDMNALLRGIQRQLDKLAQLPSKPSWLVAVDITIYYEEGEVNLIKKSGEAKVVT